jgi:CYTH domain-containing protein
LIRFWHPVLKRQYYDDCDGLVFSINVFHGDLDGLILCETETESMDALMAARLPPYARQEVTEDRSFAGGSLCRAERPEIEAAIERTKARFHETNEMER